MIFISHSTKDKDHALELQKWLLEQGYHSSQIFLDSDADSGIQAGDDWKNALHHSLKHCTALIVIYSNHWRASDWCSYELGHARASGKPIFPILIENIPLVGMAAEYQSVRWFQNPKDALERLGKSLRENHLGPKDSFLWPHPDLKGDNCPFPGLHAFDERYAAVYFGREPETRELCDLLRKMRCEGEPRFLMIVGGSGSGKSSLLKAGILPRLVNSTDWVVLPTLRYAESSEDMTILGQLARNVVAMFPPDNPSKPDWKEWRKLNPEEAAQQFVVATQDLTLSLKKKDSTVLMPIDQFEELLSPSAGPIASTFLCFLKTAFAHKNSRLLAVGTMRSDYLDVYENSLVKVISSQFLPWRLGPFPRERIAEVISQPAERTAIKVQSELLTQLVKDTPSAEALPLLAFTLEKLYRRYAGDGLLELAEYQDLGGMEGAIQKSVQRIVPDNTPQPILDALRFAFVKHLAQVNDKNEVVRLTAQWSNLPADAQPILNEFVKERLLVKSEKGQVEVAHEAIFRCWSLLNSWLKATVDILRWRRDVLRDQESAASNGRVWKGLTNVHFTVAKKWPAARRHELTDEETNWIHASSRRRMLALIGAGVTAALLLIFAGVAWWQKDLAEQAITDKDNANSEKLKVANDLVKQQSERAADAKEFAESQEILRKSAEKRLADSLVTQAAIHESSGRFETAETTYESARISYNTLGFSALPAIHGLMLLHCNTTKHVNRWQTSYGVSNAALSPDELTFLAISSTYNSIDRPIKSVSELFVQRISTGQVLWRIKENGICSKGTYSPDGRLIAYSRKTDQRSELVVRKVADAVEIAALPGHLSDITSVLFLANRKQIVTCSDDKTIKIWNVDTLRLDKTLDAHQRPVQCMSLSQDGIFLASADENGIVRIWNTSNWKEERSIKTESNTLRGIDFSPDGKQFVTLGYRNIILWSTETGERNASASTDVDVSNPKFTPDGQHLVTTDTDGAIWETKNLKMKYRLTFWDRRGVGYGVASIQISNNGKFLLSAAGKHVNIWTLPPGNEVTRTIGHDKGAIGVSVSHSGRWAATLSADGTVKLWDSVSGNEVMTYYGFPNRFTASITGPEIIDFSIDDKYLIIGGFTTILNLDKSERESEEAFLENYGALKARLIGVSPGGHYALIQCGDIDHIWSLKHKRSIYQAPHNSGFDARVNAIPSLRWVRAIESEGNLALQAIPRKDSDLTVYNLISGGSRVIAPNRKWSTLGKTFAFSTDGKSLVTAQHDTDSEQNLELWDCNTGNRMRVFSSKGADSIHFLSNGQFFITANSRFSSDLTLWEVESGREVRTIAHQGCVDVSDDGNLIAIADGDVNHNGQLSIYDLSRAEQYRWFQEQMRAPAKGRFSDIKSNDPALMAKWYSFHGGISWALDLLDSIPNIQSNGTENALKMARMYWSNGQYQKAIDQFDVSERNGHIPKRDHSLFLKGVRLAEAKTELALANKLFISGKYLDAIKYFDKAIVIEVGLMEAYLGRSKARIALNDHNGALSDANEILTRIPPTDQKDLDDAVKRFLSGSRPEFAGERRLAGEAHLLRAIIYARLGSKDKIAVEYAKASLLGGINFRDKFARDGMRLLKMGDYNGAIIAFDTAILLRTGENTITEWQNFLSRSEAKWKLGDNVGADADFDTATNRAQEWIFGPHQRLALAKYQCRRAADEKDTVARSRFIISATNLLEPLLDVDWFRDSWRQHLYEMNDFKMLANDSSFKGICHVFKAIEYWRLKEFKMAEDEFTLAISISPQLSRAYIVRGTMRRAQNRLEDALSDLKKAVTLSPKSTLAHSEIAKIYCVRAMQQKNDTDRQMSLSIVFKHLEAASHGEQYMWENLISDPEIAFIRSDPRLMKLSEEVKSRKSPE